tara:strand:+ start:1641 stop:2522 length:882 start_codon:yes stop_codon:yes gene_type:complete
MPTTTGFRDEGQQAYVPKDTLTWANLGSSPYGTWDSWTNWYQNLSSSTTLALTTDIFDAGEAIEVIPIFTLSTGLDGDLGTPVTFDTSNEDKPTYLIEGSNNSDMSSASSITMTRTSAPNYTTIGNFRYWRVTVTIHTGTNAAPNAITGLSFSRLQNFQEETVNGFNTTGGDDGSSRVRTVPLELTYSAIKFVGITPTTLVSDTNVTGTSSLGNYVQLDYYAEGYTVQSGGAVSSTAITVPPICRLVETDPTSVGIELYEPNSGDETDATVDLFVKGYPVVKILDSGSIGEDS